MRIYGYMTKSSMRVENPKTGNISIISDYCSANFPVENYKPQNNVYKSTFITFIYIYFWHQK